jgi:Uma2 family endonuclease
MADTLLDPRLTPTDPRFALLVEVAGDRKAELVDDEVHIMSPSGRGHGRVAFAITASLRDYERRAEGEAFGDNVTFLVDLPGRQSFSPDAAYLTGPAAAPGDLSLDAVDAAPTFAVEIRSKHDYGPRNEKKLAAKRADYFAAGTQVVWDVDLLGDDTIRVHRPDAPDAPTIFRRGDTADAEPAVPGWRFPVDELFR